MHACMPTCVRVSMCVCILHVCVQVLLSKLDCKRWEERCNLAKVPQLAPVLQAKAQEASRLLVLGAGGGWRMTGTNLDFVLLGGVYLVISCLVAQKMFSPSIFLSNGLSVGPMNYGFSQT